MNRLEAQKVKYGLFGDYNQHAVKRSLDQRRKAVPAEMRHTKKRRFLGAGQIPSAINDDVIRERFNRAMEQFFPECVNGNGHKNIEPTLKPIKHP